MRCPHCKTELLCYINGESYGFAPSYPFESGYYCPNWSKHITNKQKSSWSDIEIARGDLDPKGR